MNKWDFKPLTDLNDETICHSTIHLNHELDSFRLDFHSQHLELYPELHFFVFDKKYFLDRPALELGDGEIAYVEIGFTGENLSVLERFTTDSGKNVFVVDVSKASDFAINRQFYSCIRDMRGRMCIRRYLFVTDKFKVDDALVVQFVTSNRSPVNNL